MSSNPTPSEPRLSPAATMSDVTPSALTPSLHCASILQPTTPPQVVAFQSETISAPICLNRFTPFRIPPRASRASLPPQRSMPRHRFSLPYCTAPPSCSLQPLLKLSLFSLRPSLLQFVSIDSLLQNHENRIFEPVCVFYLFFFCLYCVF